ncbi:hypothetical protein LPP1_g03 [Leptolyngbya phage LPP-1]|uniref:Uncharacterized protein n=1 Tax=Leptolyngbya phage LPP-1 TaxID=2996049 RepID=A0AAE9PVY0_9CAUD|nr:hypothetical protein LPP1_g03 [Leptolyngbya phage LPP-1]
MWLVTKTEMIRPTYVHVQLLEGKSTLLTRYEYHNQVVHVTPLDEGASLPTQVAVNVSAPTQEVQVLNSATGTVWGYDWEVNASYAVGYYSDAGEFTPIDGDVPCYAMAVGIKHYVKSFVDAHALFGRTSGNPDNLRAAYPTPLSQATALCYMAKVAEEENEDQAVYSIARYLDIPHQWCLDAMSGLTDLYCLISYVMAVLCPDDESVLAARQYVPVEYEGYMTTEAEDEEAWAAIDSQLRF